MDIDKLTASIKLHEGLRLLPYKDTTGHLTIGWGLNLAAGITRDEADYLLGNRIQLASREAEAQPWWPNVQDNDARSRAFVELVYNLGIGTLAKFSKALDAAMRSDWITCGAEFLGSVWAYQTGDRAQKICTMIVKGLDP